MSAEVEATDELRERLIAELRDAASYEFDPNWPETFADRLLPSVVAVVAEARTEAFEEAAQIAESRKIPEGREHLYLPNYAYGFNIGRGSAATQLLLRAAALRGVGNQKVGVTVDDLALDEMDGNQNAEPRWSANRLEEVLREGLPDQNAEPVDTCGICGNPKRTGQNNFGTHQCPPY